MILFIYKVIVNKPVRYQMYDNLDVVIADPAGNITIMVLTPVDRKDYAQVAQKLLKNKTLNGEQVAFMLPDSDRKQTTNHNDSLSDNDLSAGYPAMEMCGLEFCGNASRAFALYRSSLSVPHKNEITVKVSGCDKPLTARIDHSTGNVEMDMPTPDEIREFTDKELSLNKGGTLVCLDGIAHLILQDVPPMKDTFEMLRDCIYENYDPDLPAFGVMFCDTVNQMMTPVVYVKDVDTTYFEGSCASGTVAAAYALATTLEDGTHQLNLQQPGGTLCTTTIKKENRIEKISLSGIITLSDVIHIS